MKKLLVGIQTIVYTFLLPQAAHAALNVPPPVNYPNVELGSVISAIVGILLLVAAVLAFLFLILGGIQWITSGGDKAGMEAARNKITAAIVGLIIVAAAWAIMLLVGQFIGFDLLKGNVPIPTIKNPGTGV
ncbi:MAG: hypothetical protein AAB874_01250 [Patescibacteria group bacterium]